MVLEPLSAFAVACNVLQLLDNGSKVLSKAIEYERASDGRLSEQKDLQDTLESLARLNQDLRNSLLTAAASQGARMAEQRLIEANQECLNVSRDFISMLDELRVTNPHAFFEAMRKSVKSFRYKEKIGTMDKKLARARDNLILSFLVYMKYVRLSSNIISANIVSTAPIRTNSRHSQTC